MVDLSLVISTRRWDALYITLNHAKHLRFNGSWEIVITDDLYSLRTEEIKAWGKQHGLTVKHVPPKNKVDKEGNLLPTTNADYGRYYNTGLLHADGEIIVMVDDSVGFKPDYVQNHYDHLKKGGLNVSSMGLINYVDYIPPEQRPEDITGLPVTFFVPRGNGAGAYRPTSAGMHLETFLKVNGFDERFDAGGMTIKDLNDHWWITPERIGKVFNRVGGSEWFPYLLQADHKVRFRMFDNIPVWHMRHPHVHPNDKPYDSSETAKLVDLPVYFDLKTERTRLRETKS